jgi:hypothetical protein
MLRMHPEVTKLGIRIRHSGLAERTESFIIIFTFTIPITLDGFTNPAQRGWKALHHDAPLIR